MNRLITLIITGALPVLIACDGAGISGSRGAEFWPVSLRVVARAQAVSTYRITVSATGMQTIGPHEYAGGQTIEMYVPEGSARAFRFERFDQNLTLTDTGTTIATIGSGMNTITVTLTAVSSDTPTYVVSYNGNQSTSGTPPPSQIKTHGVTLTLAGNTDLARTGYSFAGWNTAADGSGTDYDTNGTYTDNAGVTLYARWAADSTGAWVVSAGSLTDPDGNRYTTVTIGTQVWTVENLRTTKYNDGTPIPVVPDSAMWVAQVTRAMCFYDNSVDTNLNARRGALYNWYVASSDKIAPRGWHVPSDSDWIALAAYLGGYATAGGAMKDSGLTYWQTPNTGATNSSGFTAVPAGYRGVSGRFIGVSRYAYFWSSTVYDLQYAYHRVLKNDNAQLTRAFNIDNYYGMSIRLIRD